MQDNKELMVLARATSRFQRFVEEYEAWFKYPLNSSKQPIETVPEKRPSS